MKSILQKGALTLSAVGALALTAVPAAAQHFRGGSMGGGGANFSGGRMGGGGARFSGGMRGGSFGGGFRGGGGSFNGGFRNGGFRNGGSFNGGFRNGGSFGGGFRDGGFRRFHHGDRFGFRSGFGWGWWGPGIVLSYYNYPCTVWSPYYGTYVPSPYCGYPYGGYYDYYGY